MLRHAALSDCPVPATRRRRGVRPVLALLGTTILGGVALVALTTSPQRGSLTSAGRLVSSDPVQVTGTLKPPAFETRLLDPRPILGAEARRRWPYAPLPFVLTLSPEVRVAAAPPAEREPAVKPAVLAALPTPEPAAVGQLPPPRPPGLRDASAATEPKVAVRPARKRAASREPETDNRTFFEKLFGLPAAAAPRYAALESGPVEQKAPVRISPSPAVPAAQAGVAVYDISARVVRLPNGDTLEAHSGLGDKMDDPRFVHVRMHGATPPGTYDLTEREAPFHGVRALRLNPIGGSAAVHGRAGLLAHTFMLGPNGQSNGCVSFRDYDRFLQAYLRGEIRQLVVVAGRGWDGPFGRRFGGAGRASESGRDA